MTFPNAWDLAEEESEVTSHDTPHDFQAISASVKKLIQAFEGEMTRKEIQDRVGLKDRKYFRENYLLKALDVEMIIPVGIYNEKDKTQKYMLTQKGKTLQKQLRK